MADFHTLLTHRPMTSWIHHPEAERFDEWFDAAQQRLLQLAGSHQRVVLSDRHPVKFLARLAAIHVNDHVAFLCNPDWADREWQQVQEIVQPQAVLGNVPQVVAAAVSPPDIALPVNAHLAPICIPTGGTSGQLKFACHTWTTLTAAAVALQQHLGESTPLNSFCLLPLFHVSGLMQFVRSLVTGGQLFLSQSKPFLTGDYLAVSPDNWCLSLVPTQLKRAIASPQIATWLMDCRAIFLGGAPAWPSLLDEARKLRLPVAPAYGATETAAQVATLSAQSFLAGVQDCTDPLPHVSIGILDDLGGLLPVDRVGQIAIQSPSLALGYVPASQALSSTPAGWIPDDIGFLDANGRLHVLGRSSDTIVTGGENVFPAEVEAAIRDTQLVEDVAVVGIPDEEWGEVVTALCVLSIPASSTIPEANSGSLAQIATRLSTRLARYKHPKRWALVEALPRNRRGKVDRPQLRHLADQTVALGMEKTQWSSGR
ncbi:MAG: AMP-binding protein [Cyanobacteria bacterium P01_A01_bin.3]